MNVLDVCLIGLITLSFYAPSLRNYTLMSVIKGFMSSKIVFNLSSVTVLSGKMYLVLDLKLHFPVVYTPYGLTV